MGRIIRNTLKTVLVATSVFALMIGAARASMFGEENVLLSKMLVEDIQQTFRLQDIVSFAGKELDSLNKRFGYEKWINKGLDQVKDYGFLKYLRTDDFVIGNFQDNMERVGFSMNGDAYTMGNLDEWIDQVWGKAPEMLNSRTQYPGSYSEWQFQQENDLPGLFLGSSSMSNMVNRSNAQLSYKHALWNMAYNEKIKQTYMDLLDDAQSSNPGAASRITAQSSALQNIQLGRLDDTQSTILRLMAAKELDHYQNKNHQTQTLVQGFTGVANLFKTAPTLMR